MTSPPPPKREWEPETTTEHLLQTAAAAQPSRSKPHLKPPPAKLAVAGAQGYSHPYQDEPRSQLFIYQFLIELMFTHDCEQMINLLQSSQSQIVRRSL